MKRKSSHIKYFNFLLFAILLCTASNVTAQSTVHVIEGDNASYFTIVDTGWQQKVSVRVIPDSVIDRLKNDKAFWYANTSIEKPAATVKKPSFIWQLLQKEWLRTLLWIVIAGAFIAILLWYLAKINLQLFRQKDIKINKNEEDHLPQNIFSISYLTEIADAEKRGNYQAAVRLHFLQSLSLLSARGAITYSQEKTNSDYLVQLLDKKYYNTFFKLTRSFEYIWYGKFKITAPAYILISKDFNTFNQQLSA